MNSTPSTRLIEYLRHEAQRRGFQRPIGTNEIAVEFKIELPDELAHIPIPKFFLGDKVAWCPLPGDDDLPEGGYVIGMKYNTPNFEGMPVSPERSEVGWNYLIHLAPDSPSRSWIQTDWAAESDLTFQEPYASSSPVTEQEGIKLEP